MNEVFIVETDKARLVLRGHRRGEKELVEFEHDVMEVAREAGIPAPRAVPTKGGQRVVGEGGRWWSLLAWLDGHQPPRGRHSPEQAQAMGETLGRIHAVLETVEPPPRAALPVESTEATLARADELVALIEALPSQGADEAAAIGWLRAQREWLRSHVHQLEPTSGPTQTIHGDYHDANLVFREAAVAGVVDWDKADGGSALVEVVRAVHLSFGLEPRRCEAFFAGYRRHRRLLEEELDLGARSYGYNRDRSLWFFDELYRQGNERLRPLLNHRPFVPFHESWDEARSRRAEPREGP